MFNVKPLEYILQGGKKMDEVLTQALIEAFQKRATEKGDDFNLKGAKVQVRCLQPGQA
jgi:hypothetical protein